MAIVETDLLIDADELNSLVIGLTASNDSGSTHQYQHKKAQVLYVVDGFISIFVGNVEHIVPPRRAIWIPPGVKHTTRTSEGTSYRSLFVHQNVSSLFPKTIKIVDTNSLMRELIERMVLWNWDKPIRQQQPMFTVLCDEMNMLESESLSLVYPEDRRLIDWLYALQEGEMKPQPLKEMARDIGASSKTISRIFTRETGMAYQYWRQRWRLHEAICLLSNGSPVTDVAKSLDFSSVSAFISFFRKIAGDTPGRYLVSGCLHPLQHHKSDDVRSISAEICD
ncbi:AraC family transcriptional regulator [Veronia nyctiphanis]|uniref:AraC family transcriptional regulator n=1 Tax=Veronia nyctiphanis TaxID=1278244 RepID=A0A4Q0YSL0_9GAMM|nr:helix-turn-helix transcriptional regulator [Veronia nyctiphanis]RXJ72089.1 AraC family transcriptional regulator [Veronia nyctiphanis]